MGQTVSVVIPTYNRAHLLGRAIQSVLNQTLQGFEVLVVDDCSSDNSEELVAQFQDTRIRYLRHQVNQGAPAARNTGMAAARGEYIAFLDSDDEWLPTKLEKQVAVFQVSDDPSLGVVLCGRKVIYPTYERTTLHNPPAQGNVFEDLLALRPVMGTTTSAFLVHRRVPASGVWFDPDQEAMQDWDFLLTASRKFAIRTVAEILLVNHREDGGFHVHTKKRVLGARNRILEKYADDLRSRPWALARHHRGLAGAYRGVADMSGIRRHLRAAQQMAPSRSDAAWVLLSRLHPRSFMTVLRGAELANRTLLLLRLPQIPHPFG